MRQWNAVCDVCGYEFKNHQLKQRWDGKMVCKEDWEPRHPQDFAKIPRTEQPLPWTRPEPADIDVSPTYDTTSGTQENTRPSGTFNTSTL